MSNLRLMMIAVTPLALLGAILLHSAAASAAPMCAFAEYSPVAVAPFSSEENIGYGSYSRLRGAQVYVAAREGLTKEWLTLSMQRMVSNQGGFSRQQGCGVPVKGVTVSVVSSGGGFWVQLGAQDEAAASVLLHWAERLAPVAKN